MWLYELTFFISSIYLKYKNISIKLSEEFIQNKGNWGLLPWCIVRLVKYSVAGSDGKEAGDNAQLILTLSFK